jgi:hypothetical protein
MQTIRFNNCPIILDYDFLAKLQPETKGSDWNSERKTDQDHQFLRGIIWINFQDDTEAVLFKLRFAEYL